MSGLFFVLLAISLFTACGFGLWYEFKRYEQRKLEEAQAEARRRCEVVAFADKLRCVLPGAIPAAYDDLRLGHDATWSSKVTANALLDLLDAVKGSVVGRYESDGFPFLVEEHQARGHAPEWTVTLAGIPLILPASLRERHVYSVGKSGAGKTTHLRNRILQDIDGGEGVAVIASEQELLTEELLPFIPEHRLDDVIYVNPADTTRPVSLNPLHVDEGEDFDLKLDETLSIFHRLIADEGGTGAPRMEIILRYVLATTMAIPGTTLLDIPRLLDRSDDTYRTWAMGKIESDDVRQFWKSVYPAYPKDAHLSLINRIGRFLQPRVVRALLCQPGASLNVRRAMDTGKILLFNSSDGILGEQNAQTVGQLVAAKLQVAAMSRANIRKEARRPFHLYIDEFQSFCGAGISYQRMLSRARKYNLTLTLAHQQCGQIPESVMREILGNVGSLVIFRVGATDARRLARELAGVGSIEPTTLTALRVGEACCLFDRTCVIAKMTPPPRGGSPARRDEVIRRSRMRYGVEAVAHRGPRPSAALGDLATGDVF